MTYPGEFIATSLVQLPDGSQKYVVVKDFMRNPTIGWFAVCGVQKLERPEVCRKYKSIPVVTPLGKTAKAFQDIYGRMVKAYVPHYRLEEIHE